MKVPIVNKNDEIIAYKDRAEVNPTIDIVRSASLWITNSEGCILIAQRKLTKRNNPGKWGEAVGGTVEEHETYESTMLREAKEEIGVSVKEYSVGPKQYIDSSAKYFVQWYTTTIDEPVDTFTIQADEVEQLAWVDRGQLLKELRDTPEKYIDEMHEIARLFLEL